MRFSAHVLASICLAVKGDAIVHPQSTTDADLAHAHRRLAGMIVGMTSPASAFRFSMAGVSMPAVGASTTVTGRSSPISMSSKLSRRNVVRSGAALVTAAALGLTPVSTLASAWAQDIPSEFIGDESIMRKKAHGSTEKPVQDKLRFGVDRLTANDICSFNRDGAESQWTFLRSSFQQEFKAASEKNPMTFYDSVSGKPLFKAPVGRSAEDFFVESRIHGWPSFRDSEVVWQNIRVLRNGETVSVDGTHLGHNLPDRIGNRFCINLVSVSGQPASECVN